MALIIDVTTAFSEEEAQEQKLSDQTKRPKGLTDQERYASGIHDPKPEYMLRKVLDKEDELYADWNNYHGEAPTRTRSAENLLMHGKEESFLQRQASRSEACM